MPSDEVVEGTERSFFTGKYEWGAEGSCGETLEALREAYFLIKGVLYLKEVGFQWELPFEQPTYVVKFAEHGFFMLDVM